MKALFKEIKSDWPLFIYLLIPWGGVFVLPFLNK